MNVVLRRYIAPKSTRFDVTMGSGRSRKRFRRVGGVFVTCCVGAFADKGNAIICIADKSVTYGEDISGEGLGSKIVKLPSGITVMISGRDGESERYISKLSKNVLLGKSLSDSLAYCEEQYHLTREELLNIYVLKPALMKTSSLHDASLLAQPNDFVKDVIREAKEFRLFCSLILCGFDEKGNSFIVNIDHPGVANDYSRVGFHAIGSGDSFALARLSCWSEIDRNSPIDQVLFAVLDAKISSETNPFVGGEWDAVVITREKRIEVPKELISALDKAWVKHNRSPYWKSSEDDLDDPPEDWKKRAADWVNSFSSARQ